MTPLQQIFVTIRLNQTDFVAAMKRVAKATDRAVEAILRLVDTEHAQRRRHQMTHHKHESPAQSAIHTAYDARRRARRNRNRR